MKKAIVIIVWVLMHSVAGYGQGWFELGTGANKLLANQQIFTICTDDSNNVYAAGDFNGFDPYIVLTTRNVAKWDVATHTWSILGGDVNGLNANSAIFSICADKQGNIYAAGDFTDSTVPYFRTAIGYHFIAKYTAATGRWDTLGHLNATRTIRTLCIDTTGNVYAAGAFYDALGCNYVAKWDVATATWNELYGLCPNDLVYALCVDDSGNVYATGQFTDDSGHAYVGKYSAATGTWSEMGSGFYSAHCYRAVSALALSKTIPQRIFAGVWYSDSTASVTTSNVYQWNGVDWSLLGGATGALNPNNAINALATGYDGKVYATGWFSDSAGYTYIAEYDTVSGAWGELGTGSSALHPHSSDYGNKPIISTLCVGSNNTVYAAGTFRDSVGGLDNYFYVAEYGINTLGVSSPIQFIQDAISVYPNPVKEILYFDVKSNQLSIGFEVYDVFGKMVGKGEANRKADNEYSTNVKEYNTGIYFIKANNIFFKILKM